MFSAGGALLIFTSLSFAGVNTLAAPAALLTVAVCGFLASAFLYLAFSPPAGYLRWVEQGA